jgi:hypothetical protein
MNAYLETHICIQLTCKYYVYLISRQHKPPCTVTPLFFAGGLNEQKASRTICGLAFYPRLAKSERQWRLASWRQPPDHVPKRSSSHRQSSMYPVWWKSKRRARISYSTALNRHVRLKQDLFAVHVHTRYCVKRRTDITSLGVAPSTSFENALTLDCNPSTMALRCLATPKPLKYLASASASAPLTCFVLSASALCDAASLRRRDALISFILALTRASGARSVTSVLRTEGEYYVVSAITGAYRKVGLHMNITSTSMNNVLSYP